MSIPEFLRGIGMKVPCAEAIKQARWFDVFGVRVATALIATSSATTASIASSCGSTMLASVTKARGGLVGRRPENKLP